MAPSGGRRAPAPSDCGIHALEGSLVSCSNANVAAGEPSSAMAIPGAGEANGGAGCFVVPRVTGASYSALQTV